jgi:hypothetical protein
MHERDPNIVTSSLSGFVTEQVDALQASVGPAPGQATATRIAHKYRRVLKNGTGADLTHAEL